VKPPRPMPPIEKASELYEYNPETGHFIRKKTVSHNAVAGQIAGTPDGKGYLKVAVGGFQYYAHRLAWLFTYGDVPLMIIDHINGVGTDNRICNLRLATKSQNAQNQRKAQSGNKTGLLGVYLDPRSLNRPYYSQIQANGRLKKLGHFKTAEEAFQAYLTAKRQLHEYCTLGVTP